MDEQDRNAGRVSVLANMQLDACCTFDRLDLHLIRRSRASLVTADLSLDSPMQGSISLLPSMEAIELLAMDSEQHELPILRAVCSIGPNSAITAAKLDHRKIGECRRCDAEANNR
jgi:hypothetical protein